MTTRRGWGRPLVALAAVAGVAAGCTGTDTVSGPDRSGPVSLDDVRLVGFDSCDELLDWFHREAATRVGPYGLGDASGSGGADATTGGVLEDRSSASAPTTSADGSAPSESSADGGTSTTNTQEPGIGEPDLAWTDGTRLVTVVDGSLRVVDLDTAAVTATIDLSGPDGAGVSPLGLLVEGDHAVVLQQRWSYATATSGARSELYPPDGISRTVLTRVDLGAEPAVVGEIAVDGEYVDARMIDGVVRAVVRSSPAQLGFVYPSGSSEVSRRRAEEANREIVAETSVDDWIPSMTVTAEGRKGSPSPAVDCGAVDHPAAFGGFEVVTVIGLDLVAGAVDPLPSAAVVAGAGTVYASDDGLFVTTTRYPDTWWDGGSSTTTTSAAGPDELRTDVHQFSLPAGTAARYEASGSVPGQLLGQFALSQHDGDLRVATTTVPTWGGGPVPMPMPMPVDELSADDVAATVAPDPGVSESRVSVLRRDGDALRTIGLVTGLGPTEQIRGVRFAGPQAYVVTFRQTDPLYVIDLRDPTAPRVAGELKIPGYSSYLQVLGEGRVLGLGQDATDTGRTTGFQESLFDVSDPADPQRLAQLVVPYAHSLAESDHHALLWWDPSQLLAVPVERWGSPAVDQSYPSSGVLVSRVTDAGIEALGTIGHPGSVSLPRSEPCPPEADCQSVEPGTLPYATPIERTLVADGRLVTVSAAGVKVSDMTTLADLAWIAF